MTGFLITGASSGLGLQLALAALRCGHQVIGATRDASRAKAATEEFERLGGKWLEIDVSNPSAEFTVKEIAEKGNVDVLVNSAAYALLGPVEDISDNEAHAEMETNFHGTLRTIRGVLPSFRTRGSGTIVNVTSGAGFVGFASRGLYAGSKFAVEGMSEALANELEPFNIRVIIAEPGSFKTNFINTIVLPERGITKAYEGTPANTMIKMTQDLGNRRLGNTQRASEILLEVILGTGLATDDKIRRCLRVPLGEDCLQNARKKWRSWGLELDIMEPISKSVGLEAEDNALNT